MADGVTAEAVVTGGLDFGTDEDTGNSWQVPLTKIQWGPNGTFDFVDAASGKGFPIQGEAAENAAVTGNPVQVGGRFDSSPRTLGNGDVGAFALTAEGYAQVIMTAGTASIGKLGANSGVDIGDVDVTSVTPGISATNLGKAEDAAHSSGDVGVMALGVRNDAGTPFSSSGDYLPLMLGKSGGLHVDHQRYAVLDAMDATTGWGLINNDSLNLATATNHVYGTTSLSFDKVDGAGNTVFAGIEKTIPSTDVNRFIEESIGSLHGSMFLTSIADVAYLWFRAGTDSSNYNEWRIDVANLTANEWLALSASLVAPNSSTGNGWDSSAVTYMAVGAAFNAQDDTLSGILIDALQVFSGAQTQADISSAVNTSLNTSNINVQKIGNKIVNTQAGNVSTGTQRMVLANDQNFVHIEDTTHTAADAGILGLAIRNDDLATLVGTDGDYAGLQLTQNGALLTCHAANDDYKYGVIDDATSGNNTLQAAAGANVKIRVLSLFMVSVGTVLARFEDGAGGTALTGQMSLIANMGFTLPYNPAGWFETSANTLLNLELSAAVSVDGNFTYIEVDTS